LLADPQTSGGLLVAVDPVHRRDFEAMTDGLKPIGTMGPASDVVVALH
jgi:selenophosphate synthase